MLTVVLQTDLSPLAPFSPSQCRGEATFFSSTFTLLSTTNNIEGNLPAYTGHAAWLTAASANNASLLIINMGLRYSEAPPTRGRDLKRVPLWLARVQSMARQSFNLPLTSRTCADDVTGSQSKVSIRAREWRFVTFTCCSKNYASNQP